jgi:trimethylamine--corrinoid protein Co-methyltransferase
MNTITPALGGVNLVHDAGRIDFGKSGCFEALVMADEIIDACRRILRGITVDDDRLAFDAIQEVGIGGTFLTSRHTLKYYQTELWTPQLASRLDYHAWKSREDRDIGIRAKNKAQSIRDEHEPAPVDNAVQEEIHRIIMETERIVLDS